MLAHATNVDLATILGIIWAIVVIAWLLISAAEYTYHYVMKWWPRD